MRSLISWIFNQNSAVEHVHQSSLCTREECFFWVQPLLMRTPIASNCFMNNCCFKVVKNRLFSFCLEIPVHSPVRFPSIPLKINIVFPLRIIINSPCCLGISGMSIDSSTCLCCCSWLGWIANHYLHPLSKSVIKYTCLTSYNECHVKYGMETIISERVIIYETQVYSIINTKLICHDSNVWCFCLSFIDYL